MTRNRYLGAPSGERLQKALATAGYGSRRAIERLIKQGKVLVNGKVADVGHHVTAEDWVQLDGARAIRIGSSPAVSTRVLAYNKRVGEVVTRSDEKGRLTVFKKLPVIKGGRWISVGRLDINTSGLLLLTNNGELANRLTHPRYKIDREYAARIFGHIDKEMLKNLRAGVHIDGNRSAFSDIVEGRGEGTNRWYTCLVQSGHNREVRRLWESQGLKVSRLIRVRFGNVMLPTDLGPGRYVELGGDLLDQLCLLARLRISDRYSDRKNH
jgi:23S rRNA pseudouridine2605 synthase